MIVLKFGGSSVANAERIRAVAEIVRGLAPHRPLVVVSALGGVTDLLEQAQSLSLSGDRDGLDRIVGDLERRHRWALAGSLESPSRRHDLNLELDRTFEDLRQRLRSMRILGERTARAADGVMACGERLASRIVAAAFVDHGLAARWIDAGEVMRTDNGFGAAVPDLGAIRRCCAEQLAPLLDAGELPVLGGFYGCSGQGDTTTLGRGGSDTSAAVLGLAMQAREIQIWTDVDGLMTADPRLVPKARTLEKVSFEIAAELAFYGARVLHPASIAPALASNITVRVLNSLRPEGRGTVILGQGRADVEPGRLASLVSRRDVRIVRVASSSLRADPAFAARAVAGIEKALGTVELCVSGELTITAVVRGSVDPADLEGLLDPGAAIEVLSGRALICLVGSGLEIDRCRNEALVALAEFDPELVIAGSSRTSLAAVVRGEVLERAVRELHRRFFEQDS